MEAPAGAGAGLCHVHAGFLSGWDADPSVALPGRKRTGCQQGNKSKATSLGVPTDKITQPPPRQSVGAGKALGSDPKPAQPPVIPARGCCSSFPGRLSRESVPCFCCSSRVFRLESSKSHAGRRRTALLRDSTGTGTAGCLRRNSPVWRRAGGCWCRRRRRVGAARPGRAAAVTRAGEPSASRRPAEPPGRSSPHGRAGGR